jgi:flagellin
MSVVNTNLHAQSAQHALAHANRSVHQSVAELSTGKRINSAADDAIGLVMGNKMTSQIRSLDMAVRNANDGISMLQTADAATASLSDMLNRMSELAIQSANDTNTDTNRTDLHQEFQALQSEISNVLKNTQWNGMAVLDGGAGNAGAVQFQVGSADDDTVSLSMTSLDTGSLATAQTLDISTQSGANSALSTLADAATELDNSRSQWGAVSNRLLHAADNATNVALNQSVSRSRIVDTDYALATANLAKAQIIEQAGTAMLSQANQHAFNVLALLS